MLAEIKGADEIQENKALGNKYRWNTIKTDKINVTRECTTHMIYSKLSILMIRIVDYDVHNSNAIRIL